jgi:hypothetical protein
MYFLNPIKSLIIIRTILHKSIAFRVLKYQNVLRWNFRPCLLLKDEKYTAHGINVRG